MLMACLLLAGVCSLKGNARGVAHMARCTLLYYAGTTAISVALGIALVSIIFPGRGSPLGAGAMDAGCREGTAQVCLLDCLVTSAPVHETHMPALSCALVSVIFPGHGSPLCSGATLDSCREGTAEVCVISPGCARQTAGTMWASKPCPWSWLPQQQSLLLVCP